MTKAEKALLQKLENEYILLNELHQLLLNFGQTALDGGGLCGLAFDLRWMSDMPFDYSIFDAFLKRIHRDLKTAYSVWLFRRGAVKPRIEWLENEMVRVEKEAQKLLARG
jgi:hypothetical protein